ncbi:MAG: DinB family protein [Dehalococcoidia bacterium]
MSSLVEHARMLFAYDKWANAKIFDAASHVPASLLEDAGGAGVESIRGSMAHVLVAHITWYQRIALLHLDPVDMTTMDRVRAGFDASYPRWHALLDRMPPDEWSRVVAYRDSEGTARERPLGLLLTHVVNHGAAHRGETGMMLAAHGWSPGDLDIVYFFDEWVANDGTR